MKNNPDGFTLVELLVALAVSSFLMAGISLVYSALSESVDTSKELENAQEVLRYSSEVFTRSLKQTKSMPLIPDASTIVVVQDTSGDTDIPKCFTGWYKSLTARLSNTFSR